MMVGSAVGSVISTPTVNAHRSVFGRIIQMAIFIVKFFHIGYWDLQLFDHVLFAMLEDSVL